MNHPGCKLCALPIPSPPIKDDGHVFCCIGCREVYKQFGEDILINRSYEPVVKTAPVEGDEAFLRIEGMHCSSCEVLIERMTEKVDGVLSVTTNYATSTARVIYDPDLLDSKQLPSLMSRFGYKAQLRSEAFQADNYPMSLLRAIAVTSLASVVMMLYLAFYYPTHLGLVSYEELEPVKFIAFVAVPRIIFILTTILLIYGGAPIFRGAWIGLRTGVLNMDNLLAVAILAAYFYSVAKLVAGSLDLYFDVTATIIAVVTIGRFFERNARDDATSALTQLLQSVSPIARVQDGENFHQRNIDELQPGDRVVIWPGETIPVNGEITKGQVAIDESLMTGETYPIARKPGDEVLGGTLVVEGELEIRVGQTVENQMENLARVLWNVQSSIAGARGFADQIARLFVPAVLILAVLIMAWKMMTGSPMNVVLLTGLATLIVSCPCTFGLAIPLTSAAAVSNALRRGIIFTSADIFDKGQRIDIVALDKTGTLSTGNMTVTQTYGPPETVAYAAAVERRSEHPIARAIARLNDERHGENITIHPGRGAVAEVDGGEVAVGSKVLFGTLGWEIPENILEFAQTVKPGEGVISYVGWQGVVRGAIVTQDQSRPDWQKVTERLRNGPVLYC